MRDISCENAFNIERERTIQDIKMYKYKKF